VQTKLHVNDYPRPWIKTWQRLRQPSDNAGRPARIRAKTISAIRRCITPTSRLQFKEMRDDDGPPTLSRTQWPSLGWLIRHQFRQATVGSHNMRNNSKVQRDRELIGRSRTVLLSVTTRTVNRPKRTTHGLVEQSPILSPMHVYRQDSTQLNSTQLTVGLSWVL